MKQTDCPCSRQCQLWNSHGYFMNERKYTNDKVNKIKYERSERMLANVIFEHEERSISSEPNHFTFS